MMPTNSDPVLHLLAGPNGAGKSTFNARVLSQVTHLPFVNADEIANARWPGEESAHAYDASRAAADMRVEFLSARKSFVTELSSRTSPSSNWSSPRSVQAIW